VYRLFLRSAGCAALAVAAYCASAGEIDPIKVALLVDGMASRGSGFDAAELHALGVDGLAAVLNYLLPDTAPPPGPQPPGPPEAEIRGLIARLDADDFTVRETATQELIVRAKNHRLLIEEAWRSDSLEVRLRAERVMASWEARPGARLSAYLSGFWTYLENIEDTERLKLLATRTAKAFEQGMPEGDRLHMLRLCIAGVAHGRDDASCNILRPLVRHPDVRVATLVTETAGAYKKESRFVPQLLIDALASDQQPVVESALRFLLGSQDPQRREPIRVALRRVFETGSEPLKFQACLPLIRDYQDADAWLYVLAQTKSTDSSRVRTAWNWIGDTKNCGRSPNARLLKEVAPYLASAKSEHRRAGALALGAFAGAEVARRLIALLGDSDPNVHHQAEASLLAQPDRPVVAQLLHDAAGTHADAQVRSRAAVLLTKVRQ
jgi:hypothetical protein